MIVTTIDVHTDMSFDVHFAWPDSLTPAIAFYLIPQRPPVARPGGLKPGPASVNQRMLDAVDKDHSRVAWSVRRWAHSLSCSIATVHKTAAWKRIQAIRALDRAERRPFHQEGKAA